MRRRGSAQQCLWLGPGRYFCCRGRRHTYADAHCYCDGDRDSHSQCYCNRHAPTHANTTVGAIAQAAPHAVAQAVDFSILDIQGTGYLVPSWL